VNAQTDPDKLWENLVWIDGRPLQTVMEPYRRAILRQGLFSFRPDGPPQYRRILTGRSKKCSKSSDAVLASLYKLLLWKPEGHKGNECFFVASDIGQANDNLDLTKKMIRCNPVLDGELIIKSDTIERRDGRGFLTILPAQNALGLHGKTYLFLVIGELHTQKNYEVLQALEIDRTRPDSQQWFASYASLYRHAGVPLVDLQKQHEAKSDPRLFVSWYAGTVEEACPSLNGPLGPTTEDIQDAKRSLPSLIFRRLYMNEPGQPDGAAFDFASIEACIVKSRTVLPPQDGVQYTAFVDPSGGSADDFTLAVAHADTQGRVILDCLIDQGPRTGKTFSPESAIQKFCDVLKLYRVHKVVGDRYAGEWPREQFKKLSIDYELSDKNRSQLYSAFEPMLNGGLVEMLDSPKLMQQLVSLIRRGIKIDAPSGEHEDHANAVAGALVLAQAPQRVPGVYVFHGSDERPRMPDEHLFMRIG
jgi:hypothetical protein